MMSFIIQPSGGGNGLFLSQQIFTSSGTWTKPAGVSKIRVIGVGGGGSGGGPRPATTAGAGGGGAGGYFSKILNVSALTSETVTIGAGGAVQVTNGANGNNGGATSFGASYVANGGQGGASSVNGASGGTGGTATGGDLNISGQTGMAGNYPTGTNGLAGTGGSSILGFGAPSYGGGGSSATGYGAGGVGSGGAGQGSAGTSGIVIVEEYS